MTPNAPDFDADLPEYAELYDDDAGLEEDIEVETAEEIDLLVRRVHAARGVGA